MQKPARLKEIQAGCFHVINVFVLFFNSTDYMQKPKSQKIPLEITSNFHPLSIFFTKQSQKPERAETETR